MKCRHGTRANSNSLTLKMAGVTIPESVSTDAEEVSSESDVLENAVVFAVKLFSAADDNADEEAVNANEAAGESKAANETEAAKETEETKETVAAARAATTSAENAVMIPADKVVQTTKVDGDDSLAGPGANQLVGDTDKKTVITQKPGGSSDSSSSAGSGNTDGGSSGSTSSGSTSSGDTDSGSSGGNSGSSSSGESSSGSGSGSGRSGSSSSGRSSGGSSDSRTQSASRTTPKTGDTSNAALYFSSAAASLGAIFESFLYSARRKKSIRRRKKEEQSE